MLLFLALSSHSIQIIGLNYLSHFIFVSRHIAFHSVVTLLYLSTFYVFINHDQLNWNVFQHFIDIQVWSWNQIRRINVSLKQFFDKIIPYQILWKSVMFFSLCLILRITLCRMPYFNIIFKNQILFPGIDMPLDW